MNQHGAAQKNAIMEFLTPEAMLTPGVAGSLTMMFTNALAVNFDAPRAWTGLVLSFVFGLLVLVSAKSILTKAVFYVLNSLVIFSVAVGANGIGVATSDRASFDVGSALVAPALAQTGGARDQAGLDKKQLEQCANIASTIAAAQKSGATNDDILKLVAPCQSISKEILGGPGTKSPKSFFAPW